MQKIEVYSDGGARGNPGPGGSGFVVYIDGKKIYEGKKYLGKTTNNQAEYNGVLEALAYIKEKLAGEKKITFYLDSELVVKQLRGEYKIKNQKLQEMANKIKTILNSLGTDVSWVHVPREKNKLADKLVNEAIDSNFHLSSK